MGEHTRRQFLGQTLAGAAVAGQGLRLLPPVLSAAAEPQLAPAVQRGYTAGRFALEIDGQSAGWLESADGGDATSDVVLEKLGPDHIQHKHLAGVKYEDITVNCGTGMSRGFYDWIKTGFDKQFIRKKGAVVSSDYSGRPISRMEWSNALIREVGFPACDAASKDAAKMTVKITPEFTRRAAATQGPLGSGRPMVLKKWLSANFRLKIDSLDCSRVNKIEAVTVKTVLAENFVGEIRSYQAVPTHLEVPNLVVTTAESFAADFYRWHEDFVIKGNNGRDKEKGGTLEFLTPDLKESLFTLTFYGLGIFKLTPEKVEAGSENIRRLKAEMYCQNIGFTYGAGTWA